MRRSGWLFALCLMALAPGARAQREDDADSAVVEVEVAAPSPEVRAAWEVSDAAEERAGDDLARESDSFARIHEADEALPELEAARRMVGYDLLDGVR